MMLYFKICTLEMYMKREEACQCQLICVLNSRKTDLVNSNNKEYISGERLSLHENDLSPK